MPATNGLRLCAIAAIVLAGAWTCICATPVHAAGIEDWQPYFERAQALWQVLREFILASYQRVPGLVLGLAALLVVPPFAILGLMLHRKGKRQITARAGRTDPGAARPSPHSPAVGAGGYVELIGPDTTGSATRLPLPRTMVSIGRHEDNAIRIPDKTVHRYHAVIHWTPETDFVITDLSGEAGNGVLVNGTRVTQASLASGDIIELGQAKLRFGAAAK